MLIVAGPKRMIQWAYILGQYTAKLRRMWEETVDYLQQEIDEAGVDLKLPKEVPTRANINRTISEVMKPVTAPVEEALNKVDKVSKLASDKPATAKPSRSESAQGATPEPATDNSKPSFGTWSGASTTVSKNGEQPS